MLKMLFNEQKMKKNSQSNKINPNDILFYPYIRATLNPHQRSFLQFIVINFRNPQTHSRKMYRL